MFLYFFIFLTFFFTDLAAQDDRVAFDSLLKLKKEHQNYLLKLQGKKFLNHFPKSEFSDQVNQIIGDLFFNEKRYQDAILYYDAIKKDLTKKVIFLNYIECLYQLKAYENLHAQLSKGIEHFDIKLEDPTLRFYFAESLYKGKKDLIAAKKYYEALMDSSFARGVKIALIEIYSELENFEESSKLSLELSEDLAYHYKAAEMQIHFDKEKALETFTYLQPIMATLANEIALYRLQLLRDLKKNDALITLENDLKRYLSKENHKHLDLQLAAIYLEKKEYQKALDKLESLLFFPHFEEEKINSWLLLASYHLNNDLLFQKSLKRLEAISLNRSAIWHMAAQYYKKRKLLKESFHYYEKVLAENDYFPEKIKYEYIALLFEQNLFSECYKKGQAFLAEYPYSKFKVNVSLLCLQSQLLNLSSSKVMTGTYWENIKKEKARLLTFFDNETVYPAYYFLSLCDILPDQTPHETISFCNYALSFSPNKQERLTLLLHLFSAYSEIEELKRAASTLLQIFEEYPDRVEKKHLLWLAHFYFQNSFPNETKITFHTIGALDSKALKAIELYQSFLGKSFSYTIDNEMAIFRLALLFKEREVSQTIGLLKNLSLAQQDHENLPWQTKEFTLFYWGQSLFDMGDLESAKSIFLKLIKTSSAPYVNLVSKYYLGLIFKESSDLAMALKYFKEVKAKKMARYEPLHLKAAKEFGEISSAMAPQDETLIYKKLIQEFTSFKDVYSKEYYEGLNQDPEKKQLHAQYMELFEKK